MGEDGGRRSDEIGHLEDVGTTFGMGYDLRPGVTAPQFENPFERKFLMYVAGTIPKDHVLPAGELADIGAQVAIGGEDDRLVGRY